MQSYDADLFKPPAPIARVIFRDPSNGNTVDDVLMLIDSGADITLVPQACIDDLESTFDPEDSYELEGFDGQKSKAQSVELDLVFLTKALRGRYLVINSMVSILGRDILNHFVLVFDGPRLIWDERQTSSL
jgi:hypothetical protein